MDVSRGEPIGFGPFMAQSLDTRFDGANRVRVDGANLREPAAYLRGRCCAESGQIELDVVNAVGRAIGRGPTNPRFTGRLSLFQ